MILKTLKRALWIAALWGVPVSAFHTLQQVRTPPHIRTLAELRIPNFDRLPQISNWQGPLPQVLGQPWLGSPSEGFLEVSFSDLDWFNPGSAHLTVQGKEALSEIQNQLADLRVSFRDLKVTIESHTDSSPVIRFRHLYSSNWQLSQARAESVQLYLNQSGLGLTQIRPSGLADSKPAPQMRRITFKLTFAPPGTSWAPGRMEVAQK